MLLLPVFMADYGLKGIWMSVFHSISAFCNAGFDILGTASRYVSISDRVFRKYTYKSW